MKIKIVSVELTEMPAKGKGKPYSNAQVVYMNERGEPKKWNLVSFSNPQVFDTLKDANAGDVFEITTTKNGEYTNWASASKYDASAVMTNVPVEGVTKAPSAAPAATGKPFVSTYETPEERAVKQRLIVRQSSLAQSLVLHGAGSALHDVLDTAQLFADWVYKQPDLFEMTDDIPY